MRCPGRCLRRCQARYQGRRRQRIQKWNARSLLAGAERRFRAPPINVAARARSVHFPPRFPLSAAEWRDIPGSFLEELKRRRLFQSLALYGALALGAIEATDIIVGALGLPEVLVRIVVVVAIIGVPAAAVLGWAYDLTSQGLQRVGPTRGSAESRVVLGRRTVLGIAIGGIGGLGLLAGYAYWSQGATGVGGSIVVVTALLLVSLLVVLVRTEPSMAGGLVPAGGGPTGEWAVAVLPFRNLSAEGENQYFADGITEELIYALANVPSLRTLARSTVFALAGKDRDVREVGRDLQVDAVLEGTARTHGDQLRLTVQLVETRSGSALWSQRFDRSMRQVFEVQEEIARAVVQRLLGQTNGTGPEAADLVRRSTDDVEAYQLFLQGRFHWNQRTPAGIQQAIEYFRKALHVDPRYALAHSGLADALIGLAVFGVRPPVEVMPTAEQAARAAVEFGPDRGDSHASLGHLAEYWLHDWELAGREYDRAVEADPHLTDGLAWRGQYKVNRGWHEDGLADIRAALALEPLNVPTRFVLGMALYHSGRTDESIAECRKVLDMVPTYWPALSVLALALISVGDADEALVALDAMEGKLPPIPQISATRGVALATLGRTDEADAVADALLQAGQARFIPSHNMAMVYTHLGRVDDALDHLEAAYEERWPLLHTLRKSPFWDPLREHPRFHALEARLGFTS